MKGLFAALLLVPLLTGCATMERLEQVRSSAEKLMEETAQSSAVITADPEGGLLTKREAEALALAQAKLNRGQISRLRTRYDWEEGQPVYQVEFRQGPWEHRYEIHAQTGQVLSWEKEKD